MERKTKHRILGILVVAAFGIIMLPFFEGGSSPIADATIVKAPPFPESSATAQAALNPPLTLAQNGSQSAYNQQPDDTISANSPTAVNAQPVTPPSVTTASPQHNVNTATETEAAVTTTDKKVIQADNKEVNQKNASDEKKQVSTEVVKEVAAKEDIEPDTAADEEEDVTPQPKQTKFADKTETTKAVNKPVKPVTAKLTEPVKHHAAKKVSTIKEPFVPQIKPFVPEGKSVAIVDTPIDANGLAKLKNAAWVIQIGSFKNKTNALRLVNQLRANGYRAFIQQVSTNLGDGTRVFVGPESKQNTARALAAQLESNMHIRGIVISYKPLAL